MGTRRREGGGPQSASRKHKESLLDPPPPFPGGPRSCLSAPRPLSPLPFYSSPPKTPTSFLPPQNPPWASLVPDKVLVLTSTPR